MWAIASESSFLTALNSACELFYQNEAVMPLKVRPGNDIGNETAVVIDLELLEDFRVFLLELCMSLIKFLVLE